MMKQLKNVERKILNANQTWVKCNSKICDSVVIVAVYPSLFLEFQLIVIVIEVCLIEIVIGLYVIAILITKLSCIWLKHCVCQKC